MDTTLLRPLDVLHAMGSFLADDVPGSIALADVYALHGRPLLQRLDDLRNLYGRKTCPVFRQESSRLVRLRQAARSAQDVGYRFGRDGKNYDGAIAFGQARLSEDGFLWSLPRSVVSVALISDRLTAPNFTLVDQLDFTIERDLALGVNQLRFFKDPFAHPAAPVRPVYDGEAIVDHELPLWLHLAELDVEYLRRFFGFAIGFDPGSTQGGKDALNAAYDAMTPAPTEAVLGRLLGAVGDAPVAEEDDTVELVAKDASRLWVACGKRAYSGSAAADATVIAGEGVVAGQSLSTALEVHSLRQGVAPADLPGLGVSARWLDLKSPGLFAANAEVPLAAERDADDDKTLVRFSLGDNDDRFWAEVRAREAEQGVTLAALLVGRPDGPEPGPAELPPTINPLAWLAKTWLRNALLVRVKVAQLGPDSLPLSLLRRLRYSLPAHVLLVVVVELDVTVEGPSLGEPEVGQMNGFSGTAPAYTLGEVSVGADATGSCR